MVEMGKKQLFLPRLVSLDRRLPPFTPRRNPALSEVKLGTKHLREDNPGYSIASFRRAAQENPELADAHFGLGVAILAFSEGHPAVKGNLEKQAMASFSRAIGLAGLQNLRGMCLQG